MLLVEEKQVPIKIELVPMRSYGDKPAAFLRKVPSGLLPAIEVNGKIITECTWNEAWIIITWLVLLAIPIQRNHSQINISSLCHYGTIG
jgi:glutathione S-transferase